MHLYAFITYTTGTPCVPVGKQKAFTSHSFSPGCLFSDRLPQDVVEPHRPQAARLGVLLLQ